MPITTHILDTSRGKPASNITITLHHLASPDNWQRLATAQTNPDGRAQFPKDLPATLGTYRLTFQTAPYFAAQNIETFYPQIEIQFHIKDPTQHHHIPLLLSPFGYSTYRGS